MTSPDVQKAVTALSDVIFSTNSALTDLAQEVSQYDIETAEQIHAITWQAAMKTIEIVTGNRWNEKTEQYEPSPDFGPLMTGPLAGSGEPITGGNAVERYGQR